MCRQKSGWFGRLSVLSKNQPADSVHSGFLHSHVHCHGQYRDAVQICVQLSTKSSRFSVAIVPDNVESRCQWYEILTCYRAICPSTPTSCSCATDTARTKFYYWHIIMTLASNQQWVCFLLNYQQRIIYAIALRASRTFTLRFLIVGKVGHPDPPPYNFFGVGCRFHLCELGYKLTLTKACNNVLIHMLCSSLKYKI